MLAVNYTNFRENMKDYMDKATNDYETMIGKDTKGNNLFCYCFNNPLNMKDMSVNWPKWIRNFGKTVKNTIK